MSKRKYVVKYKEFQKSLKAVETWEKVKHNPQALKTKFRELKKVIRIKKIACQDFFKSTPI